MNRHRSTTAALTGALIAVSMMTSPTFAVQRVDENPGVAPIQSRPHGQSYSEWAATWWKWTLENTQSHFYRPDGDPSQIPCIELKKNVWLLFGTFNQAGAHVERSCTVPTGSALFFPLVNVSYSAWPDDPPDTRTEAYVRSAVAGLKGSVQIQATIDGVPVVAPTNYYEESALFAVTAPAELTNPYGRPAGEVWEPSVDAGYYLFLNPLPPGQHTIAWLVTRNDPAGQVAQDVRYTLTVKPGK